MAPSDVRVQKIGTPARIRARASVAREWVLASYSAWTPRLRTWGTISGASLRAGPRHLHLRAVSRNRLRIDPLMVIGILAIAAGATAAATTDESEIGPYGLIQALSLPYFLALAILACGYCLALSRRDLNRLTLLLYLLGVVLLITGAPSLAESQPRFSTAWLHAQMVDHFAAGGPALTQLDARFSWPGFFTSGAAIEQATGLATSRDFLRWAPAIATVVGLLPLYVIGRRTVSERATWLGLFAWVGLNWVGQDYFAPQAAALVAYLTVIAITVTFFRTGRPWLRRIFPKLRRVTKPEQPDDIAVSRLENAGLIVITLGIMVALAVSHQLTPPMLVFALAGLVVAGRSRLHILPVVAGLILLAWLSLGATDYWRGHLNDIFGGLGSPPASASASELQTRFHGSVAHTYIVSWRAHFSLAIYALAGLSWIGLWISGRRLITLGVLVATPTAAITQSYGGEGPLRIFLLACPFASLIMAEALCTLRSWATRWFWREHVALAIAVPLVVLMPISLLLRFGNERYERITNEDAAISAKVPDLVPPGSTVLYLISPVMLSYGDMGDYTYTTPHNRDLFASGDLTTIRSPLGSPARPGDVYLVMTSSQEAAGEELNGWPKGWFTAYVAPNLTPANGWKRVYQNGDIDFIYRYVGVAQ